MDQSLSHTADLVSPDLLEAISKERNLALTGQMRLNAEEAIANRLKILRIEGADNYLDRLQAEPGEYAELFKVILPEKSFVFDEPIWHRLSACLSSAPVDREHSKLRLWVLGGSDGHEAYGLAVGLAELFGESFLANQCKIFATSDQESILSKERNQTFDFELIHKSFPMEILSKYFVGDDKTLTVRPEIRRAIIFGKHNVISDPPISKMDLILCRQTLPFYSSDVQKKVTSSLLGALNDLGILVIGEGERILEKDGFSGWNGCEDILQKTTRHLPRSAKMPNLLANGAGKVAMLIEAAVDASAPATVCITNSGLVAAINTQARVMFNLLPQDVGKPLQDLEISYRPVELRSLIENACKDGLPLIVNRISRTDHFGKSQILDVHVYPLVDSGTKIGAHVQFHDASGIYTLQEELASLNKKFHNANEELQSSHEELETTNEELHSTNEELETTNEELQCTNEELETMNEELQSTNSELELSNSGQRELVSAVDRANVFLQAILGSMNSGVFVLDDNGIILSWNQHCTELWGLKQDEVVGKSFLELDIGFPVHRLEQPFKIAGEGSDGFESITVDAINRRGMKITCFVKVIPLADFGGLFVVMEDEKDQSAG